MKSNLLLRAEYANIIVILIKKPYSFNSITKLIFTSFGVKHALVHKYSNRKMDFIQTFLSSLSVKLTSHPEELVAILDVISTLEDNGWIKVSNDTIQVGKNFLNNKKISNNIRKNSFLKNIEKKEINPLEQINKMSVNSFLEEVLQYV